MIEQIARIEVPGAGPEAYAVLGGVPQALVRPGERMILGFGAADPGLARQQLRRRGLEVDGETVLVGGMPVAILALTDQPECDLTLDHVVVHTSDAERAVADFGGRLGLDLRLDRHAAQWSARMLFFRCGPAVVEVVQPTGDAPHDGPDALWGVAWRTPDLDATVRRLAAGGIAASPVRAGRKPGSRVCSLRERRLGLPTLLIEHTDRSSADRPGDGR